MGLEPISGGETPTKTTVESIKAGFSQISTEGSPYEPNGETDEVLYDIELIVVNDGYLNNTDYEMSLEFEVEVGGDLVIEESDESRGSLDVGHEDTIRHNGSYSFSPTSDVIITWDYETWTQSGRSSHLNFSTEEDIELHFLGSHSHDLV